ncbi:MAG: hypothetical protein JNJ85_16780 [Candidatus Kapabacteria bacterium]|nr:hypothetical protein [Candidatus Kapabacteria bacterium]
MDITSAAIASVLSTIVSVSVNLYVNKNGKRKDLNDQLDNILKIAIQYPYLENEDYTSLWKDNRSNKEDQHIRYDLYCTMLFNYLERLCSFYKFNMIKIEEHIYIKDWIRLHKEYWLTPTSTYENIDGYSKEFRSLIKEILE